MDVIKSVLILVSLLISSFRNTLSVPVGFDTGFIVSIDCTLPFLWTFCHLNILVFREYA